MGGGLLRAQHLDNDVENFYHRDVVQSQLLAAPLGVRESDVVFSTFVWRTIDFREKFNQFFYYPTEEEGIHGRFNLAYLLWNAIKDDEIPIFEDDECRVRLDNQFFVKQMTTGDTIRLQIINDDENLEYQTVVMPKEFTSEQIVQLRLKEAWFIDKQSTQMWVRILAIGLCMNDFREPKPQDAAFQDEDSDDFDDDDERQFIGVKTLFWVPAQLPAVRRLLSQHEAMNERNVAKMPTWQYVFDARYFSSFVTRQSNRFNRPINSYILGEDALLEADRIENELLNISSDMWEY